MSIKSSRIILENPSGAFYAGNVVAGKFELVLANELKLNSINFASKGRARVLWTEGGGQHSRTYYAAERYFHNKMCLYGKQQTGSDTVTLQPGTYTYPFSFTLPTGIPSSFEFGSTAWVRYSLKACVDIPWSLNKYTKRMITVVRPLDLNAIPDLENPATKSNQKNLCCLCCKSDPISATVSVDRRGYVPGESIPFRAEIQNGSGRTMASTKARFRMDITCHAMWKTRTFHQMFSKLKHGELSGGSTDVWMNEKLHIPPVAPSYLHGCKIIDLNYQMLITVDPAGPALDLNCPLEVVIGTVPLSTVAQQHGVTLPASDPLPVSEPPPGSLRNIYSETAMPTNIPHVTLSESAMGRTNIKEGKQGSGTVDYAPVYTYCNWEKSDLDTLFTVKEK